MKLLRLPPTLSRLCHWLVLGATLAALPAPAATNSPAARTNATVYVLPIREDIMPPLVYVVRRGVKAAMDANADALVLDMNTDGGRVDVTEEILKIIGQFKGDTATFVNDRAFSAGAFISVGTKQIFMAPQSVIGAAAPIMMAPGGAGAEQMPDTMEVKMTSAIRALVRTQAEKNGHNIEVVEAMIDTTKELKIGDELLNKEGNILTLTDRQAAKLYGEPPKPLLSAGTKATMDEVLAALGYAGAKRVEIVPTGAEKLAFWITKISPLLLLIGMVAGYIEFKTPGFGLPGIVAVCAFAIYFLGGYVAGLSGAGWAAVFLIGVVLVILELFVFPGTFALGLAGVALMLVSLVMAMADIYPGGPVLPTLPQLQLPLRNLSFAALGALACALLLARFLPQTPLFRRLVSQTASGTGAAATPEEKLSARLGETGVAMTPLHPGGRALFGEQLVDVITRGEQVAKGRPIRIIGQSGPEAVVEEIPDAPAPRKPA